MVGIVFYQKENKRWEKVGQVQESGGSLPQWQVTTPRETNAPANTATSIMTKGSFELVSPIGS